MALDWDKLRIFHGVAEAGSFTHAGNNLHLSQSAVSRQVSGLEESLGCALFHRHARGLMLTEQGELLFRTVHEVYAKLSMAEHAINESKEMPKGPLKISTTVALGSIWLTPRIREFLDLYPDIDVSLVATDYELDLSMGEADCAVRLTPPTQPDLVRRHLTVVHNHIFAAPEYIQRHGQPADISDLANHKLIAFGKEAIAPVPALNWLLEIDPDNPKMRPVLTVNNVYGILRAVQSGLGIAALPDFLARDIPNLVRVLAEHEGPSFDAYFVYPEELRDSRRIAAFRDFLVGKISETRF